MRGKGAPFCPSSAKKIKKMLELAQIKPTDRVVDLGSGDGRLVFAAAEQGAAKAVGYELDPFWFKISERKKAKSPHAEKIQFLNQSYWDADWSSYDIVFSYHIKCSLKLLSEKLKKELKPGSRIVSNFFQLPDWECKASKNGVYLYIK